jgi:hypothetical protein
MKNATFLRTVGIKTAFLRQEEGQIRETKKMKYHQITKRMPVIQGSASNTGSIRVVAILEKQPFV